METTPTLTENPPPTEYPPPIVWWPDEMEPPPTPPEERPTPTPARGRRPLVAIGAVAALVLAAGVGGVAGATLTRDAATPATTSLLAVPGAGSTGSTGSLAEVAAAVRPAVVEVLVNGRGGSGVGSGVVIAADGSILTNEHVVGGASQVTVRFSDGTTSPATVVGEDPTTDLAVIRATAQRTYAVAVFGDSDAIEVGDTVIAVGSPLGLEGSVTAGIVSALHRPVRTGQSQAVLDALQTDAAINPGNSGGPLVDAQGRVVGITTAIATAGGGSGSIGLGFAIPSNEARRVADELVRTGTATHARLGVSVGDATDETGALVQSVTPGGAAAAAGLASGDVILAVDGVVIAGADGLIAIVGAHAPGDKVTVTYLRGGERRTAEVTLGSA